LVSRAISYPATKDRPEVLVTMRKKKGKVGRTTYFHTSVGQAYATYEGVRVALQRKAGSSWRTVKRARLDGMSRHSFRFRPTEAKTYRWRVRIGATEFHTVATSKVQRLKVRPQRR
jgi:hypothetical protein